MAISHEQFYVPQISEKVNIGMDYKNWYMADQKLRVCIVVRFVYMVFGDVFPVL